jgi:serine/threonine-protein kinase RsbW
MRHLVAEARPRDEPTGDPNDRSARSDEVGRTDADGVFEPRVQMTVPAETAYVSVLRTVCASLAARRGFSIEEIDDLKVGVDEACTLLLAHATSAQLTTVFAGASDAMEVRLSVTPVAAEVCDVDQESFAWMVLSALADSVTVQAEDDALSVSFVKSRVHNS